MMRGGPVNGNAPGRVTEAERRVEVSMVYPDIEQVLSKVQLVHPKGSTDINRQNNKKWSEVFNQFLVNEATLKVINGGQRKCSP